MTLALRVRGLGKRYRLQNSTLWALRDVSFDVQRGDVVGLIGHNGAGKSTLFKILARITEPTEGTVGIKGRLAALLEVGTGFHRELTGRENIYLNGSILGMKKREIDRKLDQIVSFAEVGPLIDMPVKHYSSGMFIRLAFAVAAHVEPEVLLIDEVLAVGDLAFQQRCLAKVRSLGREGCTILFVSHDLTSVRQLCPTTVWVAQGRIATIGPTEDVVRQYSQTMLTTTQAAGLADTRGRPGSGEIRVTDYWIELDEGQKTDVLVTGKPASFVFEYATRGGQPVEGVRLSVQVQNEWGASLLWLHNQMMSYEFGPLAGVGQLRCRIPRFPLAAGVYPVRASLALHEGSVVADDLAALPKLNVIDGDFYGSGYVRRVENPTYLVDACWSNATGR